jgi:hypothetical protein
VSLVPYRAVSDRVDCGPTIRNGLAALIQREHWDRIDLVGHHSFGTHLIGWTLYSLKEVKPQVYVILAGSVLKSVQRLND